MQAPRKTAILIVGPILLALIALYPIEAEVVPEWRIRVLDHSGNSVPNVPLREIWKHASFETQSHEQELSTDNAGYVIFQARTARTTILVRVVRTAVNMINPHGSTGPTAWVYVLAPYKPMQQEPSYTPGKPLIKEIVIQLPGESQS